MQLIRDTRGAVMAEAIIMLPFFVIVFAALYYLHGAYSEKLDRSVAARGCAWTHASAGCQDDLPPICTAAGADVDDKGGVFDQFGGVAEWGDGNDRVTGFLPEGAASGIAEMSGLTNALLGIGDGISVQTRGEVDRPSLFGGGRARVGSRYSVLCNEAPMSLRGILQGAYCGVNAGLIGCKGEQ